MKNSLCISVLLLLLLSCDKEANVPVPPAERLPVITCVLSPEFKDVTAKAAWSDPMFEDAPDDGKDITDAVITVSDGIITKTLAYEALNSIYKTDTSGLAIVPGKTFYLTITAGGKTATGTTTVPHNKISSFISENYSVTYSDSSASGWKVHATGDFKWTDIGAEENYYLVVSYLLLKDPVYGDTSEHYARETIISEKDFSGATMEYAGSQDGLYIPGTYSVIGVKFVFASITKEYYDYAKTAKLSSQQDPFSEPAQVISNIKNGFGVFGSYRAHEVANYF